MHNNHPLALSRQLKDEATASGTMHTITPLRSHVFGKGALALLAAACLFGVTACSNSYVIRTSDGQTFNTQGTPEFTDGGYRFIDTSGQSQRLLLSQVVNVSKS